MKLDIPEKPKDGHRVTFWRFNSQRDGLVQVRWTYFKNEPGWDVCDPEHKSTFYKNALPYVDEWYVETRYVPSSHSAASEWCGQGRIDHTQVHASAKIDEDNTFLTFEEARVALFNRLSKHVTDLRNEADRTYKLAGLFFKMEEPA